MNRLERLINLVAALLQTERPLTAEDLRERVPGYAEDKAAFRRAFERDKETLRDLGVPIAVETVPGTNPPLDGYRVPKEDYYLPDPGLAEDELAALNLAATAVQLDVGSGVEALWKLGGEVAEAGPTMAFGARSPAMAFGARSPARAFGARSPAVVFGARSPAPSTAHAALPGTAHLVPLFGAISARRPVSFDYRGRRRTLDPHRLSFRNGRWYLSAHDRDAGEERSYRLDRIESPVEAGEAGTAAPAPAPSTGLASPWELGAEEPVTARLLVDAEQAGWAEGHVGPDAVAERRPNGAVVLEVRVTNRDAFRSFALGFLDHAEVLGPPELRDDLVTWLEALCRD